MKTLAIFSQLLLLGLGTFLMIVVLLQRGRGGGLAGAFGGLGGQSAFGTKAGDVFTRITIGLAVAWVIVAGGSGYFLRAGAEERASGLGDAEAEISAGEEVGEDADFNALPTGEAPLSTGEAPQTGTDTDTAPAADDAAGDATQTPPAAEGEAADSDAATPPAVPDNAPGEGSAEDDAAAPADAAASDGSEAAQQQQ